MDYYNMLAVLNRREISGKPIQVWLCGPDFYECKIQFGYMFFRKMKLELVNRAPYSFSNKTKDYIYKSVYRLKIGKEKAIRNVGGTLFAPDLEFYGNQGRDRNFWTTEESEITVFEKSEIDLDDKTYETILRSIVPLFRLRKELENKTFQERYDYMRDIQHYATSKRKPQITADMFGIHEEDISSDDEVDE